MNKRFLIGILLFVAVMITDKLIVPIPDIIAILIELVCIALIVSAALQARKTVAVSEKDPRATVDYDPEKQEPVIRASICTDEKVAGFIEKESGRFTEVMLIKSPEDEILFKEIYKLDEVKTEY